MSFASAILSLTLALASPPDTLAEVVHLRCPGRHPDRRVQGMSMPLTGALSEDI
jgi:hypothetical protein